MIWADLIESKIENYKSLTRICYIIMVSNNINVRKFLDTFIENLALDKSKVKLHLKYTKTLNKVELLFYASLSSIVTAVVYDDIDPIDILN